MKDLYIRKRTIFERKRIEAPYAEIMEIQGEIASILKEIRKESGLSQRELKQLTGLSTKTLWELETGAQVKLESLLKCLFVLDHQLIIRELP